MINLLDDENLFYRAFTDVKNALALTDEQGKIQFANPAWMDLFGYDPGEILCDHMRLAAPRDASEESAKEMWKVDFTKPNDHWSGEIVAQKRGGGEVYAKISISSFRRATGEPMGFVGTATNIADKNELERITRTREDLDLLKYFAERLAHELGTTLGVIRGRAELFQGSAKIKIDKARSAFEVIIGQVDRATKIVDYLLTFASSSRTAEKTPIQLKEKVKKALQHFENDLRGELISLDINIDPSLIVLGDRKRLFEAIVSLIENAIDAIKAAPERTSCHRIRIHASNDNDKILLEIEDSGCGIAKDKIVKIFQPFFTTKDVGKGVGMGLTMAARFLEDMGGEITAVSSPNGAKFKVLLPRSA